MVSRIKKLTKLSLDIIKTHGLSYYLHVAIEELENQKLDLLRGNIQIKKQQQQMQESESEKYRALLEKLDLEPTDKDILENQLNYKPKFTIIIPFNKENSGYIEPLFTSIKDPLPTARDPLESILSISAIFTPELTSFFALIL